MGYLCVFPDDQIASYHAFTTLEVLVHPRKTDRCHTPKEEATSMTGIAMSNRIRIRAG